MIDKQENIFSSYIEQRSIFKNKDVLNASFIPSHIVHRDDEIRQIGSVLAPSLRGYKPSNMFLFGTTGTGKTICTKFVINQLMDASKKLNEKQRVEKVKAIYINCKMKKVADTEYRLFAQLLKEFGHTVPDTGLPTDVLYRKFFNIIEKSKQIIVIVLDEIDTLVSKVGDEFLYNLTRINTELSKAQVSIVGITNNISFSDNLDARVKSSLGEEELIFKPYNAEQLRDILLERIKDAFNTGVIKEGVINKCAALAAQEHGDARRALDLLRVAAEIAERNNETSIREEHVDMAEDKIDLDRVIETVKSQPKQSQAVLYSIILSSDKKSNVLTGDVFDYYWKICKENGLRELTQRRISDLIGELDMLGIVTARIISKGRYGRSREIKLAITDSALDKVKNILIDRFGRFD